MALSLGPLVAQIGALGVVLLLCIVALVIVHDRPKRKSPADALPSYDDTEERIDALTQKVRRRAKIKGALARWTSVE